MKASAGLAEKVAPARRVVVHCRREVVIVQLTGDDDFDALLQRVAAKGGCVVPQPLGEEE